MAKGPRPPELPPELVRAQDRLTFIYLERCHINRDANAITATDDRGTVHIPAATLGTLLLGPGTTVTQQAMVLMAESASTVVWSVRRESGTTRMAARSPTAPGCLRLRPA